MSKNSKKVVIIGAGFGGLSSACVLAKNGFDVTVLEKNTWVGGRAQVWEKDGWKFDMGPSWYLIPDAFDKFFEQFGKKTSDYYSIEKLDPGYQIYLNQKENYLIPTGKEKIVDFFEKIEAGSGKKLSKYLDNAKFKYKFALDDFAYKNFDSLLDLLNPKIVGTALKLEPFRSLKSIINKKFKSPLLRHILGYPAVFLGGFPNRIPGVYSLLNWVDFGLSAWYPQGGFSEVAKGFYTLANELGVKFIFESEVKSINVKKGKATSVSTTKNIEYLADYVIANADYQFVEQNLLSFENRYYSPEFWESKDLASSCLNFYLGLDIKLKNVSHHTFFFDTDWQTHGDEVYGKGGNVFFDTDKQVKWPEKPLFYIHVPSKTEPNLAPENGEALFILIPVASGLNGDDETLRQKYLDQVLERIEKITGQEIKSHIKVSRSYCIRDFKSDYNAYKGNAFGLGQTLFQTANFRPKNYSPKVKNLFYAGQFTIPGTGTSMAMISGQIAAQRIVEQAKK